MTLYMKNHISENKDNFKILDKILLLVFVYAISLIPAILLKMSSNLTSGIQMLITTLSTIFILSFIIKIFRINKIYNFSEIANLPDFKENILFTLTALGVIYIVTHLISYIGKDNNGNNLLQFAQKNIIMFILIMVIFVPIIEELIFRVGIINLFFSNNKIKGVLISSLVFGAVYCNKSLNLFLTYFLIGMIFAVIYIKTNKIGYSILCHVLNNSLACIFLLSLNK